MSTIIAGLETVRGPRELTEIVNQAGAGRVVFSLDLFDGSPRMARAGSLGDRGSPRAGAKPRSTAACDTC